MDRRSSNSERNNNDLRGFERGQPGSEVDAEQRVGGHAVQLVVLPFELVDEPVPLLDIKERLVGTQ
jgi:hypothetical protein